MISDLSYHCCSVFGETELCPCRADKLNIDCVCSDHPMVQWFQHFPPHQPLCLQTQANNTAVRSSTTAIRPLCVPMEGRVPHLSWKSKAGCGWASGSRYGEKCNSAKLGNAKRRFSGKMKELIQWLPGWGRGPNANMDGVRALHGEMRLHSTL